MRYINLLHIHISDVNNLENGVIFRTKLFEWFDWTITKDLVTALNTH